jgi:hypothetical protein
MIPRLRELLEAQSKDGYIVTQANSTINRHIRTITEQQGLPNITEHCLRHSFASLGYHLRLSEIEVMSMGGWSDSSTVHDISAPRPKGQAEGRKQDGKILSNGRKNPRRKESQWRKQTLAFDMNFNMKPKNHVSMRFLRRFSGVRLPSAPPMRKKARNRCGCGFSLYSCGFADFFDATNLSESCAENPVYVQKKQIFFDMNFDMKNQPHY